MELYLFLILIIVVGIGGFYVMCHIVKIWTGCDSNEAVRKIHNFMNGTANIDFTTDEGFIDEIWTNVRNIVGEKRYNKLVKISNSSIGTPLLSTGYNSGLPYIAVSVFYEDDGEKKLLETILTNVLIKYLQRFGYDSRVLINWKTRYDLSMPFLEMRYAKTREHKRIMNEVQLRCREEIIKSNIDLVDETEDDDLTDE